MTNTDKIRVATRPFIGKSLTAKEIQAVVLAEFPDTQLGSILPSDHAGANSKGNVYADQLFSRESGQYLVLADSDIVVKPKTARSRMTLSAALASAQGKLVATVPSEQ
jgi:hypothetical protein